MSPPTCARGGLNVKRRYTRLAHERTAAFRITDGRAERQAWAQIGRPSSYFTRGLTVGSPLTNRRTDSKQPHINDAQSCARGTRRSGAFSCAGRGGSEG